MRSPRFGIEESLNYEFTGRTHRLMGEHLSSRCDLERGIAFAVDFPHSRAALFEEMAILMREQGNKSARSWTEKAIALYTECEASLQVRRLRNSWDS